MPSSQSRKLARATFHDLNDSTSPITARATLAPAHGYTRAQNCSAPVSDEPLVHDLIAQRLRAKQSSEFAKADELRQRLLHECGVELFDGKKCWKVVGPQTGVGAPPSLPLRSGAVTTGDSTALMLPVASAAVPSAAHGYTRAGSDTARVLDEPRVHALLLQRLLAKKAHQFDRADALREELRRECGVEVFDKTKFWRVVGGRGHVPLPEGQSKPRGKKPPKVAAVGAQEDESSCGSVPAVEMAAERLPSRVEAKTLRKHEAAAAAVVAETPIASGFGHAMLLKMGWAGPGSALRAGALAEPFQVRPADADKIVRAGRRGLVADDDAAAPTPSLSTAAAGGAVQAEEATLVADSAAMGRKRKRRRRAAEAVDESVKSSAGDQGQGNGADEQPSRHTLAEAVGNQRKRERGALQRSTEQLPPAEPTATQAGSAPVLPRSSASQEALLAVCALKRSDRSLTAKQVHALLPERGFELSLAAVKRLCSEAARDVYHGA